MRAILAYAVIAATFCSVSPNTAAARCKLEGKFPGTVGAKNVDEDRYFTLYKGPTRIMLKTYLKQDKLVLVVDPPKKQLKNCYRNAAHVSICDYNVRRSSEGVYDVRVYNKSTRKIDYDLICRNL